MNMADIDTASARIRGLQEIYAEAHQALLNWAAWALDARGCLASGIKPPATFRDYRAGDYDDPDLELNPYRNIVMVKAEAPEREPYDQRAAEILADRLTSPGGPSEAVLRVLKVAYCNNGGYTERQMPGYAGTSLDGFCESLETALKYAGRFL